MNQRNGNRQSRIPGNCPRAVIAGLLLSASLASAQDDIIFQDRFEWSGVDPVPLTNARVFFWGNSAVNHDPFGPEDSDVGVPMQAIATAAGLSSCADGDYTPFLTPSMLEEDAYPPPNELNIPNMTLGASCADEDFARSDYTVGVLQDNNINWQTDPEGWGDVAGAVYRVNEAKGVEPGLERWYLYSYQAGAEGAPDAFGPRDDYLAEQAGFNAASRALQDDINAADASIELLYIPIGEVWLDLLGPGGLLEDMPLPDLFFDPAPHQNLSAAEVMGAVAFSAIFRQPVPAAYAPDSSLDPRVVARWEAIVERVWTLLTTEPLRTRVFGDESSGPIGEHFWVAPDGSDGNPGTQDQPWGTLDFAVDQLTPGDTLNIDGGVWSESIALETSGTPQAPIRVIGRNGATIGNDPSADAAIRISASHIEVRGLNMTGSRTGILIGDGLYPLNDVCADPDGFNEGVPPGEEEFFSLNCEDRASQSEAYPLNPVFTDIVIDGRTDSGDRAVITITDALDPVTGEVEYFNGITITDEAERVAIRGYEITGARYGLFADGLEQIRRLDDITVEDVYVHGTYHYGIRMPARRGYASTPDPEGDWVNENQERIAIQLVDLRTQSFTNLSMRDLLLVENGFTADPQSCNDTEPDGEAYGNMLLQGWVNGVIERSVFRNGPYWGIDCLICDNVTYRNNVFSMSEAALERPRCFPDPADPWPIVGLEVNGGTGNRVVNNSFYGYQSGIFLSMFPEDFAETEISVEVRNNIFWVADKPDDGVEADAVEVFPPNDILASDEVETFGNPYNPVGGYTVERPVEYNLANIEFALPGYSSDMSGIGNRVDADADVSFIDGDGGDLRVVAPSSAVVDQGQILADVVEDFDGNLRPEGTAHDLGAFEGTQAPP
jgi:hypothetical protein